MYIPEKKLITKVEGEFKKRIPFLSCWKIARSKKTRTAEIDLLITAKGKKQAYHFCVEVKTAGYPQYIRDASVILKKFTETNPSYCPVIAVPFISERGKEICDEHNIGYLDFSGNAKIVCGNIFIYTEGRSRPKDAVVERQALFSPKAARVTKFLLGQPENRWTQKEISERTRLSKGMVSRVINTMIGMGYVTEKDKKLALTNFDDLFSAWVESETKRRERKKSYYVWAQNPRKLMEMTSAALSGRRIKYAFTQEAGASLVAPFAIFDIVSVYVESLDKFPEKALSASAIDKGFNLTLIEAPDQYIFTKAQNKSGMMIVDNLQLYADLMKNPLRGEKQANHILKILKKGLK
ncbi:MAG: MarR family transcriptional regulator [Candidatus Omnitrophota bacterium]